MVSTSITVLKSPRTRIIIRFQERLAMYRLVCASNSHAWSGELTYSHITSKVIGYRKMSSELGTRFYLSNVIINHQYGMQSVLSCFPKFPKSFSAVIISDSIQRLIFLDIAASNRAPRLFSAALALGEVDCWFSSLPFCAWMTRGIQSIKSLRSTSLIRPDEHSPVA